MIRGVKAGQIMAEQSIPENVISEKVIGAAIEVHRAIGPGLLESVYEECLAHEMVLRNIPFERQKQIPLKYKDLNIPGGFRVDFLVGGLLVIEIKSSRKFTPNSRSAIIILFTIDRASIGFIDKL